MPIVESPQKPEPLADHTLFLRCKGEDKGRWVHAAGGKKLSDWVIEALNEAARLQNQKKDSTQNGYNHH
jgi:hypothetical protein